MSLWLIIIDIGHTSKVPNYDTYLTKVPNYDTYLMLFTPFFSKKFVTDFEKIRHFYGFYLNFSKTRQKITNPPMSGPRVNIYCHKNSQKQK